jgi:hypothetical protein
VLRIYARVVSVDSPTNSTTSDDLGYSCSFAKRCESINTMVSFLWWIIGFYWVVSGGDVLEQDAPRLYWYCGPKPVPITDYFMIVQSNVHM